MRVVLFVLSSAASFCCSVVDEDVVMVVLRLLRWGSEEDEGDVS